MVCHHSEGNLVNDGVLLLLLAVCACVCVCVRACVRACVCEVNDGAAVIIVDI